MDYDSHWRGSWMQACEENDLIFLKSLERRWEKEESRKKAGASKEELKGFHESQRKKIMELWVVPALWNALSHEAWDAADWLLSGAWEFALGPKEKKSIIDEFDCHAEAFFEKCCQEGHLEAVKYWLTCPWIKQEKDNQQSDWSLLSMKDMQWKTQESGDSVMGADSEGTKTKNQRIKDGSLGKEGETKKAQEDGRLKGKVSWPSFNVHAHNDGALWSACNEEHWDVVRWLVLDYGIKETEAIKALKNERQELQEIWQERIAKQENGQLMQTLKEPQCKPKVHKKL